jgi:hypothetical protein
MFFLSKSHMGDEWVEYSITKKKGRECTRMKRLQLSAAQNERKSIDFNSYG